ncbi:MAG: GatB/YqeY domain-containing protein [Leptospiraceae bacterium]|nr:GatB/YqeY domain-containing protein [Leptospiraceae bacterium]MCP5495782.1 GatB/YqeY domain-containing protein [Leptospiraceae bacterium]
MSLQTKINEDLKIALKAKNEPLLSTLRMLKSDIQYELTKTGASSLSDEQVISILKKNSKQRLESSKEYQKAGREDLAKKEEAEASLINSYMPAAVSEEDIKKAVTDAIRELSPKGTSDMGKVMGKVMQVFKGKNVDGSSVSSIVKAKLEEIA